VVLISAFAISAFSESCSPVVLLSGGPPFRFARSPLSFFALDIIPARGLELDAFSAPQFKQRRNGARSTNRKKL
jgi:hypothetical protein